MFRPKCVYWRSYFLLIGLLWIIATPLLAFIFYEKIHAVEATQVQRLSYASHMASDFVHEELSQAIEHSRIIAQNLAIVAQVNHQPLANPNDALLGQLGLVWQTIANESELFDQIRWIDNHGVELLRINYAAAGAYRVAANELQAKADRYYVKEGLKLSAGEIYLSPLDLNIEHQAIEVPYKPTIRIVSPVFDAQGQRQGMIVINYLATQMLQHIQQAHQANGMKFWLLNAQGYWLLHPDQQLS